MPDPFLKPVDLSRYAEISPPSQEFPVTNETLHRLGAIPLVTANWGNYQNAQSFKRERAGNGILTDEMAERIDQSGFTGGWRYPATVDVRTDPYQKKNAEVGAHLGRRVFEERNWDQADILVFASASSRIETPEDIASQLHQAGMRVDNTLFYGMACAGATAAMSDLNRMTDLRGKKVVLVALESLSGSTINPDDIQTAWTFGNGGAALGWVAGEEIIHHGGQTHVIKDPGTIIMPDPYIYHVPQDQLPQSSWPSWYYFKDEEARNSFGFFHGGVAITMLTEPQKRYAKLNPKKTYAFFARNVSQALLDFFSTYQFDNLGTGIIHHPSKPVILGTIEKYKEGRKKLEDTESIILPELDFRWLMPDGVNNVSAATALFHLSQLLEEGLIKPHVPTPLVGLGIGSVIHTDVIEFNTD